MPTFLKGMSSKKIKVLVVDDNNNFLATFQKTLQAKGCLVSTTSDPEEACSLVLNDIFQLVFIDCVLFSKQGIDLAQKIRQLVGFSLEIVMMSGIVSEDSITTSSYLKLVDFLKKPILHQKLDHILKQVQGKYIHNISDSFLKNVFSENFSNDLFLQFLINLQIVSSAEFFLLLSGIFKSKENLALSVSLDGKNFHQIFFQKGLIVAFGMKKKGILSSLLSKGWLTQKDIHNLNNRNLDNYPSILQKLIGTGILSPYQLHTFQLRQLVEYLEAISKQSSITIKTDLFKTESHYLDLNENLLADTVFPYLKNLQQKDLDNLFNKDIVSSSFKLLPKENTIEYLPAVQSVVDKIREGVRILSIRSEMALSQKDFCLSILYIMMKGGVLFSESGGSGWATGHLLERYKNILAFLHEASEKEIFRIMGNLSEAKPLNLTIIGNIYRAFLKSNHIDRFSMNLPPDVIKSINNVTIKLKQIYNESTTPNKNTENNEKEKSMKKAIQLSHDRQLCKSLMEKKDYQQAFSIISQVTEEDLRKDFNWMLLYIWLGTKAPKCGVQANVIREFKASIGLAKMSLMKNPLYFYVMGLFFANDDSQKAIMYFARSKDLDVSFEPAKEAYKLTVIKEKQKNQTGWSAIFRRVGKK